MKAEYFIMRGDRTCRLVYWNDGKINVFRGFGLGDCDHFCGSWRVKK